MTFGYQYSLGLSAIKDISIIASDHSVTIILTKSDAFESLTGIYTEDGYSIELNKLHIFRIFQAFESLVLDKNLVIQFDDGELITKES